MRRADQNRTLNIDDTKVSKAIIEGLEGTQQITAAQFRLFDLISKEPEPHMDKTKQ